LPLIVRLSDPHRGAFRTRDKNKPEAMRHDSIVWCRNTLQWRLKLLAEHKVMLASPLRLTFLTCPALPLSAVEVR